MNKHDTFLRKLCESYRGQFELEKALAGANYMLNLCIKDQLSPKTLTGQLTDAAGDSVRGKQLEHVAGMVNPLEFAVACHMLSACSEAFASSEVRMGHITAEYGDDDEIKISRYLVCLPRFGSMQ